MTPTAEVRRAQDAIRHHYDVGNEFFRLWLDETMTYSCALRSGAEDTLDSAQRRKLAYHLDAVDAGPARRVLDIGCGWGAVLRLLSEEYATPRAVGLTLSDAQAAYVRAQRYPGVEVRVESWTEYEPAEQFDGIVSIGAFEHFARPDQSGAEKIGVYRDFFARCRQWLRPGGTLSLQTIAYANMSPADASAFLQEEIFPDAELPTPAEITAAAEGLFEVVSLRNDRLDYAWTCQQWADRLRARRAEAVTLVGPEVVGRYERYLRLTSLGFRMGKIGLLRIVLRPYVGTYFGASA